MVDIVSDIVKDVARNIVQDLESAIQPIGEQWAWYEASDINNFSIVSGDSINQWNDISGNNRHAVVDAFNALLGIYPKININTQNNLNVLSFANTFGSFLILAAGQGINYSTTNFTISLVLKVNDGADSSILNQDYSSNVLLAYDNETKSIKSNLGGSNQIETINKTAFQLITLTNDNGTIKLYQNGQLKSSQSVTLANESSYFKIGSGVQTSTPTLQGDIAEIIIYDRLLTDLELENNRAYFQGKWQLDFSQLVAWASYDASNTNNFVLSGNTATSWLDSSGNNRNATATGTPTVNLNTLNSLNVVNLNGSSYFDINDSFDTSTTDFTISVIARVANSQLQKIFNQAGEANTFLTWNSSSNSLELDFGGVNQAILNSAYFQLITITKATSNNEIKVYLDGILQATYTGAAVSETGNFLIGQSLLGDIAGVFVYDKVLDSFERYEHFQTLKDKWNLWTSKDFNNIYVFYDASYKGSIVESAGLVSNFGDLTPNNKDLIQNTGSRQPTLSTRNNLDVLSFDGISNWLSASSISYNSILNFVVVGKVSNSTGFADAFYAVNSSSTDFQVQAQTAGEFRHVINCTVSSAVTPPGNYFNDYYIFESRFNLNDNSAKVYVNGVLQASVNDFSGFTDPSGDLLIAINRGFGRYIECEVAEIAIYNEELAGDKYTKFINFIKEKWNITT